MPLPALSGPILNLVGGSIVPTLGIRTSYKPADLTPHLELYRKIMALKNENGTPVFSDYGATLAVRYSIGDMPNRDEKDRKEKELAAHYWSEAQRLMKLPVNLGTPLIVPTPPIVAGNPNASAIVAQSGKISTVTFGIVGVLVVVAAAWYFSRKG